MVISLQLSIGLINCNVRDLILIGFLYPLYLAWVYKDVHTYVEGVEMVWEGCHPVIS